MDISRRDLFKVAASCWFWPRWGRRSSRSPAPSPPSDAYNMADHWWGMLIDIDKCIGCGNCVRACSTENNVPDGYFRTWVERYQIEERQSSRTWIRPTAPWMASRRHARRTSRASSSPSSATIARIRRACRSARWAPPSSARTAWCWWTRPTAWAAAIACKPALTAAAICIRKRTRWTSARSAITASPRGSPPPAARTAPPARGSWWTSRTPRIRFTSSCAHNKVQVLKPYMATQAKVYYKDLDGAVR